MNFSEQENKKVGDRILGYLKEHNRAFTTHFLATRFDIDHQRFDEILGDMVDAGLIAEKAVLRNRMKTKRYLITRLGHRYVDAGFKIPPEE